MGPLFHTDPTTRRALSMFAAALLVVLSFPPFGLWALGFIALVPLHVALAKAPVRQAAMLGFGFGALVSLGLFHWLLAVPSVKAHHLVVFAAWLGLFGAAFALAWRKLSVNARPLALPLVPAAAVALDWLRGHAGFLALPWGTMGQTQSENLPLIQWASVGGEHLVTFIVVTANVAFAELFQRGRARRPLVALALVGVAHVLGVGMMPRGEGQTMRVAAIQANIDPRDALIDPDVLGRLTKEAAATKPDLVVWPESTAGDTEHDVLSLFRTRAIVDAAGVPVLFGSSASERGYNSLFLMKPGTPMPPAYRKVRLVPFAEYSPLSPSIGPRMFDSLAGTERVAFDLDGVDVEPLICFESLFADDVRATASMRPSVIALAVNDAWFGKSAAPQLHNLVSAFRAVENRRPVVIASNAGPSTIYDASGRAVARARSFAEDEISAVVRVDVPAGVYRRWGDASAFGIIAVLVLLSVGFTRRTRGLHGVVDGRVCRRDPAHLPAFVEDNGRG